LAAEIATEDALQQTTAEQAFADGERLQKQATAESLRQAIVKYEQARSLMRAGGDVRGEAIVLNNIGLAYNSLGERQMALDFFQQALPLLQAIGDRREEANTLNNLGRTHIEMRDLPKALDVFHRARLLAQAIDDRVGEAASLANRGSK
jgi:tetratricopeptide (TPR) repeat protein